MSALVEGSLVTADLCNVEQIETDRGRKQLQKEMETTGRIAKDEGSGKRGV